MSLKDTMDFQYAVDLLEGMGFMFISKERVKTLSYHVAITDMEARYERTEAILKSYEYEKEEGFLMQLKQQGIIKYSQRVETKPCVTFHSWKMSVLT